MYERLHDYWHTQELRISPQAVAERPASTGLDLTSAAPTAAAGDHCRRRGSSEHHNGPVAAVGLLRVHGRVGGEAQRVLLGEDAVGQGPRVVAREAEQQAHEVALDVGRLVRDLRLGEAGDDLGRDAEAEELLLLLEVALAVCEAVFSQQFLI